MMLGDKGHTAQRVELVVDRERVVSRLGRRAENDLLAGATEGQGLSGARCEQQEEREGSRHAKEGWLGGWEERLLCTPLPRQSRLWAELARWARRRRTRHRRRKGRQARICSSSNCTLNRSQPRDSHPLATISCKSFQHALYVQLSMTDNSRHAPVIESVETTKAQRSTRPSCGYPPDLASKYTSRREVISSFSRVFLRPLPVVSEEGETFEPHRTSRPVLLALARALAGRPKRSSPLAR